MFDKYQGSTEEQRHKSALVVLLESIDNKMDLLLKELKKEQEATITIEEETVKEVIEEVPKKRSRKKVDKEV